MKGIRLVASEQCSVGLNEMIEQNHYVAGFLKDDLGAYSKVRSKN